jgi:hypothetical protein
LSPRTATPGAALARQNYLREQRSIQRHLEEPSAELAQAQADRAQAQAAADQAQVAAEQERAAKEAALAEIERLKKQLQDPGDK